MRKLKFFQVKGFSLVEILIGMVVSSIVMGSIYSLWKRSDTETRKLSDKADLRSRMTLVDKIIQKTITNAGYGLYNVVDISKEDAIGSDTLTVYSNSAAITTSLGVTHDKDHIVITVSSASGFTAGGYIAITDGTNNEIRKIYQINDKVITIATKTLNNYDKTNTTAYPVTKERYYSDETLNKMIRQTNDGDPHSFGDKIKNFQLAFLDKNGASTNIYTKIRSINFSITGIYPTPNGTITAVTVTSNAIPRNLM